MREKRKEGREGRERREGWERIIVMSRGGSGERR